jgi:hypothetical protein
VAVNKYRRWYKQLIARARTRQLDDYSERHHVLPRSMGGGNESANLVRLTYREHFLAHWLLTKFTSGNDHTKMCYALFRMTASLRYRTITSRQYAIAKKIFGRKLSVIHKGNQYALGYKLTSAHKKKLHDSPKVYSVEARAKMGASLRGKQHTLATRKKMRAAWKLRKQRNAA